MMPIRLTHPWSENVRRVVHCIHERLKRDFTQALQSISGTRAPGRIHQIVVEFLPIRSIAHGNGGTRLHERAVEQTFAVSTVGQKLKRDRDRASG